MKYNYRRLPAALRELGPVYGLFRRKGMAPISAAEFLIGNRVFLKVDEPATWSDFDDALRAYEQDKTGEVHGIACVLQERHNMVVFDFDKPKPAEDYAKRPLGNLSYTDYVSAHMADVQDIVGDLSRGTFIERSRSGQGYHAFFQGALPSELGGYNGKFIYGDVFSRNQAIYLTADSPEHWPSRLAGQKGIEHVLSKIGRTLEIFSAKDEWNGTAAEPSTEYGRVLNLTDEQVLEQYFNRNKEHRELYSGAIKNYANGDADNWSSGTNLFQKELDKITGDPEQIYRIMFNSPRLLNAGKASNGVDRMRRTDKFFDKYLATARTKNNDWFSKNGGNYYANRAASIAHGMELLKNMNMPTNGHHVNVAAPTPVATGTLDERLLAAGAAEHINEEGETYWTIGPPESRQFIGKTPPALEAWLAARAPTPSAPPPQAQRPAAAPVAEQAAPIMAPVTKAGRFSLRAIKALKQVMGSLPGEYMKFHEPPGLLGEACRMTAKGMYEPLPYLAVPATIVAMSGIVSQAYKYHGTGLNVMFVAGAKTGVGKTQAADVWQTFIDEILQNAKDDDELLHRAQNRLTPFNIGSKVGAHSLLQKRSVFAWFNDECEPILKMLESSTDPRSVAVQNLVLKMFEISRDNVKWEPEESRTGQNMRDRVLRNVSIASFWATTIATLRNYMHPEFLNKGFGSRLLFLLYKGVSGMEQNPRNILRQIPEGDLRRTLKSLLRRAQEVESMYQSLPKWYLELSKEERLNHPVPEQQSHWQALTNVSETPEADEFMAEIRANVGVFKRTAQADEDEWPEYYSILSRVAMIAPRIAGIMAVLENPTNPTITLPQAQYAYGYCFQILGETISAFDSNELGVTMSAADNVAMDVMKKGIQKDNNILTTGYQLGLFKNALKKRSPFLGLTGREAQTAPDIAIQHCINAGYMTLEDAKNLTGRRGTVLKITDNAIWDELFKK